jgi:hypothetical protein
MVTLLVMQDLAVLAFLLTAILMVFAVLRATRTSA